MGWDPSPRGVFGDNSGSLPKINFLLHPLLSTDTFATWQILLPGFRLSAQCIPFAKQHGPVCLMGSSILAAVIQGSLGTESGPEQSSLQAGTLNSKIKHLPAPPRCLQVFWPLGLML